MRTGAGLCAQRCGAHTGAARDDRAQVHRSLRTSRPAPPPARHGGRGWGWLPSTAGPGSMDPEPMDGRSSLAPRPPPIVPPFPALPPERTTVTTPADRNRSTPSGDSTPGGVDPPRVTVYWRPGCPFCRSLRHRLRRAGVPTDEVNIWESPTGAALVRRHAHGNETVPTVDVAGTMLVNPASSTVVACAERAGVRLSAPAPRWWRRGSPAHAVQRGRGGE